LKKHTTEFSAKQFAEPFTNGMLYPREIPLLLFMTAADVATSNTDDATRKPADDLQLTKLSDTQRDIWQEVPPIDVFIEVAWVPNCAPDTKTLVALVDGMLASIIELILGGWRSATTPEVLVTTAANETTTPNLLRIDESVLIETRVSHCHIVASEEERLVSNRARKLPSQTPNPEPATATSKVDVDAAALDAKLLIKVCKGIIANEAYNANTALFSRLTAKL
jgi:hypothetical protein